MQNAVRAEEERLAELARLELAKRQYEEAQRKIKEAVNAENERLVELARLELAERQRKVREDEEAHKQIKEKFLQRCPAGFTWHRNGNGWRCAGGSHFVSDEELKRNYTTYSEYF